MNRTNPFTTIGPPAYDPPHAPRWGDRRFACECGDRFASGQLAIMHAFEGHELVRERFAGRWHFVERVPVRDFVVERLRERGESFDEFAARLRARGDELVRAANLLDDADRARGIID